MKLVIDNKIPYIRDAIASMAVEATYLDGSSITAADVKDADALIVRTRTQCNEALLKGSRVKFIATATIGYDHIDTHYLDRAGIKWCNCPGCNSGSVAQYVHNCLLLMQHDMQIDLRHTTLGIVGCGHVGSKVMQQALALGMRVIVSDPPLGGPYSKSLEQLAEKADRQNMEDVFLLKRISCFLTRKSVIITSGHVGFLPISSVTGRFLPM